MTRGDAAKIARRVAWCVVILTGAAMLIIMFLGADLDAEAHPRSFKILVETTLLPVGECRRAQSPECLTHIVGRGESLTLIAGAYGVPAAHVRALNPQLQRRMARLRPGDKVVLPLVTLEEKIISELERANEATYEWAEEVHEANKLLVRRVRELERQLLRSFRVGAVLVFEKMVAERKLSSARAAIKLLRGTVPPVNSSLPDTDGE